MAKHAQINEIHMKYGVKAKKAAKGGGQAVGSKWDTFRLQVADAQNRGLIKENGKLNMKKLKEKHRDSSNQKAQKMTENQVKTILPALFGKDMEQKSR